MKKKNFFSRSVAFLGSLFAAFLGPSLLFLFLICPSRRRRRLMKEAKEDDGEGQEDHAQIEKPFLAVKSTGRAVLAH